MTDTSDHAGLYVVWASFQRRAISMQGFFGYDLVHMPTTGTTRPAKALSYLRRGGETLLMLLRRRPDVVWVQCPPNFILLLCLFYRTLRGGRVRVVADCHNAALRAPWLEMPLSRFALARCDLILVHNEDVLAGLGALNVDARDARVLEDAPAYLADAAAPAVATSDPATGEAGHVLVPCSFHEDEPIEELLEAARLCPELRFVITGPRHKVPHHVAAAPQNVSFPGFVTTEEYDRLVFEAGIVLGLTTMDGIQLSVAGEAIGAGRALVLSDTQTLRRLFGQGAAFTDNTAEAMARTLRAAMAEHAELEQASAALGRRRLDAWQEQARSVRARIDGRARDTVG